MEKDLNHTVLQVKDLSIGYLHKKEEKIIVKNLNFEIKSGELVAIIGPNGIGKSTLLKTLTTILPSISGEILLNNKNLNTFTALALAKNQSVVLTENIPSKNLTVQELIALGRHPYSNWLGLLSDTDKHMVKETINKLQITAISHKKCFELSDGQFQKVLIARSLAQDTSLIILDEPTTHLDIYHKANTLKLLKTIAKEEHKAILFSTHEINLAIQLCDKILLLNSASSSYNDPCSLIEENKFSTLFPEDFIVFDRNSGSFIIKK
ncbi:ABC transporter ATP-binding protein [Zhouia sp. PK063]|uniref:ABC transporter ATP-binding protein n=1 Tax=Zhouia sp. PK063 TaxID=3373602 RepID=UPI00379AB566